MRNPATVSYVFNPTNRTIDFSGEPGFDIRMLKGVFHPKSGAFLYFPGKTGLGYSSVANGVVTLLVNTAGLSASDPLLCVVDDGTAVLSPGAATSAKQDAGNTLLGQILSAVQAQRDELIYTDDSGARYIRVNQGGSISWTDLNGAASAAPGAGVRPDSDSSTVVSRSTFRATAAGTGYAVDDVLDHVVVTDGDAGDLVSSFWINVAAGTRIAAPSASSITPLAPLPTGASTSAKQDTGNASLSLIATALAGVLLVSGKDAAGAAPTVPPVPAGAVDPSGNVRRIQVDANGALITATPTPASLVTGQVKIATTGTAVQLPVASLRNGLVVKAKTSNAPQTASYSATVGPSGVTTTYDGTGNGYPLSPGEAASFACANANNVWVNGTAGDVFSFEGN